MHFSRWFEDQNIDFFIFEEWFEGENHLKLQLKKVTVLVMPELNNIMLMVATIKNI